MDASETRLKRMRMRSWRRGTKEMDMILGPFADERLGQLREEELELYERLLSENDQDLYFWVTHPGARPKEYGALLAVITDHATETRT